MMFPWIFAVQYPTLLLGILERLQPCQCQKHPLTNRATRCLGNRRSGQPGRSERCSRKRCPARCNARRTCISGRVFFDLILDITSLRENLPVRSGRFGADGRSGEAANGCRVIGCAFPLRFRASPTRFDTTTENRFSNCYCDLRGQHRRDCVSDLRELSRRRSDKDVVVRKRLQSSTLPHTECTRYFWMEVRTATTTNASGNHRFRWQAWIQPINTPKVIPLSVV